MRALALAAPAPELPKCFEHDWTPWRKLLRPDGEAWERKWLNHEYRECKVCEHYQSR